MEEQWSFLESLKSRKFLLTVAFAALVVLNSALQWGVSNEQLMTLAVVFGVYSASNAYQHASPFTP